MSDLYEIAVSTNLMLAPANTPRELVQSTQLLAREFFVDSGDVRHLPRSTAITKTRPTTASSAA